MVPLLRVSIRLLSTLECPPLGDSEIDSLLSQWQTIFPGAAAPHETQLTPFPSFEWTVYALALLRLSEDLFGNDYGQETSLRESRTRMLAEAAKFPSPPPATIIADA